MVIKSAIAPQLEAIVGSDVVKTWDNIDIIQQKQILQATETPPSCIVYPHTELELAKVIGCAYQQQWRVLACGSGSKISWGGLVPNVDVVINTQRLNQLVEHAVGDLTVTAAAGMKFADLQAILAASRQFLALDPAFPQSATLGGIVATGNTGSWRQRYGSVRDQLLGITFIRADGEIVKAGGRVVKNVAGYDLMKLLTGSYGTLSMITQVTFRVYPLPEDSKTLVLTGTPAAITQAYQTLRASALTPTAADLLSTQLVKCLGIGEGLALIARFQSLTESVDRQSAALMEVGQQLGLQSTIYSTIDEANLWQKLPQQIQAPTQPTITCKIGVLPSTAIMTLTQLDDIVSQTAMGLIHAGSGLGLLKLAPETTEQQILKMRAFCESQNGFLSILTAPISLKKQLDVWGYNGNALNLMRKIKQQFDPKNIFSPSRFVGKI